MLLQVDPGRLEDLDPELRPGGGQLGVAIAILQIDQHRARGAEHRRPGLEGRIETGPRGLQLQALPQQAHLGTRTECGQHAAPVTHPRGIGGQEGTAVGIGLDGGPEAPQQRSKRCPQVDRRLIGHEGRPAIGPRIDLPGGVGANDDLGEGALEQGNQPLFDRQPQPPLRPQGLDHIRQDIAEQNLIAQALFAHDQQRASTQIVLWLPARPLDQEIGEIGIGGVETRLIGIPAIADPAQVQQQGRTGQLHHRPLLGQPHLGHGRLAVDQGVVELAQRQLGVAPIVARAELGLVAAQSLAEEQTRGLELALLGQHRPQGVPKQPALGIGPDRTAQDLDRFLVPELVAHRAGQIVGGVDGVRIGGEISGE